MRQTVKPNIDQETFVAIVDIDEDVATVGKLSKEELLREATEIRSTKFNTLDNNSSRDHDKIEKEEEPAHVVTNSELVTSMNTMRTFIVRQHKYLPPPTVLIAQDTTVHTIERRFCGYQSPPLYLGSTVLNKPHSAYP